MYIMYLQGWMVAGGWLVAKSDGVGAVMAQLSDACSVRSTGWWSYKVCHGIAVTQFHETVSGPEAHTTLGSA